MRNPSQQPVAILGAGAFGTALALYLARRGQVVRLWSIVPAEIEAMVKDHSNQRFLPGFDFPETIQPTLDLATAVAQVEAIILVVPSVGYRSTLELLKPHINKSTILISASKGLEEGTGRLFNDVIEEVLGKDQAYAILSGPSFAREVAQGLPTAVVIASHDQTLAKMLAERFNSDIFRAYPSADVTGIEIGGVAKNVIAIATGIIDGMGLGANARSALITRGLAEISRLGVQLGAQLETLMGLAGMGDLILTCMDNQSRNRRFGLAIGKGLDLQTAEAEIGQAIEGKRNAELILKLAKQHHVEMPICQAVEKVIKGTLNARAFFEEANRSSITL